MNIAKFLFHVLGNKLLKKVQPSDKSIITGALRNFSRNYENPDSIRVICQK